MTALITAAISGTLLVLVLVLFQIETRRERRVALVRFREWLDRLVARAGAGLTYLGRHIGIGTMRIVLHYVLHTVLDRLLRLSDQFGMYLERMQRRNRNIVRTVRDEQVKTYFDLVAEHREEQPLDAKKRKQIKERSIEDAAY